MIAVGERAPDAELWLAPDEAVRLGDLTQPGETVLLLFYLFDWSST